MATWKLYKLLKKDKRFKLTLVLKAGNIILSPTWSGNNTIRGHTGIIGENNIIMSADSNDGIWKENYTIDKWIKRFRQKGQMPIYVFEPIGEYKEQNKEIEKILECQSTIDKLISFISSYFK